MIPFHFPIIHPPQAFDPHYKPIMAQLKGQSGKPNQFLMRSLFEWRLLDPIQFTNSKYFQDPLSQLICYPWRIPLQRPELVDPTFPTIPGES
jgi:hypothetical protein